MIPRVRGHSVYYDLGKIIDSLGEMRIQLLSANEAGNAGVWCGWRYKCPPTTTQLASDFVIRGLVTC